MDTPLAGVNQARVIDIVGLATVPLVLALVHFLLPSPTKELLVFQFHEPALPTAWTAALVHHDVTHLVSNLLGYTIGVVAAHHFFIALNQRRRFWITVGLIFLVAPFVTTVSGYWFLHLRWGVMAEGATSQGFSGVVTAFAGMLLAILTLFLATEYDKFRAGTTAGLIVLVGMGLIANELGAFTPSLSILLSIGLLACLSGIITRDLLVSPKSWAAVLKQNDKNFVYIIYSAFVVCLFMLTFIPSTSDSGIFSNAIAHAIGFTLGLILTFGVGVEE